MILQHCNRDISMAASMAKIFLSCNILAKSACHRGALMDGYHQEPISTSGTYKLLLP